jgi:hypothetical protein
MRVTQKKRETKKKPRRERKIPGGRREAAQRCVAAHPPHQSEQGKIQPSTPATGVNNVRMSPVPCPTTPRPVPGPELYCFFSGKTTAPKEQRPRTRLDASCSITNTHRPSMPRSLQRYY